MARFIRTRVRYSSDLRLVEKSRKFRLSDIYFFKKRVIKAVPPNNMATTTAAAAAVNFQVLFEEGIFKNFAVDTNNKEPDIYGANVNFGQEDQLVLINGFIHRKSIVNPDQR